MGTMEKLREARIKANLTQEQVEELTGFKKRTISNWENGVSRPDIDSIAVLFKVYKIDPNSFYDWDSEKEEPEVEWTEEEMKEMDQYKQFLLSKREK